MPFSRKTERLARKTGKTNVKLRNIGFVYLGYISRNFKIIFESLSGFIKKEIPKIEETTLKRLVFSILGQPIFMFIGNDLISYIEPNLLNSKSAIDAWVNKSVFYALKMIELEKDICK